MNRHEVVQLQKVALTGFWEVKAEKDLDVAFTLLKYNLAYIDLHPGEMRANNGETGVRIGDKLRVLPLFHHFLKAMDIVLGSNAIEAVAHALATQERELKSPTPKVMQILSTAEGKREVMFQLPDGSWSTTP